MTTYTSVYGGGGGDCVRAFYVDRQYAALEGLKPEDTVDIYIISHNPYVSEFFKWHPKASQLRVHDCGYWLPEFDEEMREKHGIPTEYIPLPTSSKEVQFYPSPQDEAVIDGEVTDRVHPFDAVPKKGYVLFSPSAGLTDKDLPYNMVHRSLKAVTDAGYVAVFVGRNYERHHRFEIWEDFPQGEMVANLIDRLSFPGVCSLVEGAAGVVCAHSAVNMAAWMIHKPQLFAYPQYLYEEHYLGRTQWAVGQGSSECVHGTFTDWENHGPDMISRFLKVMR